MRPGLLLPQGGSLDTVELAVRAEEVGYDSVWTAELWGESSPVKLTEIAIATNEIGLGTAILNVFSRTPAVLASTAATIDDVSGGRMTLGLGTSTPKAIEDLHGMDFDRPIRRAHETIELIGRFTAGEGRVEYDGELFEIADFPALDADVPVFHAALGPANRRVVARLCDGWIPHNIPFVDLENAFESIEETAREAGRDPDEITVAPYVPSAVSDDPEEAKNALRGHLAYYTSAGEGYQNAVGARFEEEAEQIADAWHSGDRGEAAGHVSDEMLESMGVAGTPEDARQQLRDLVADTIIDRPLIVVPNQAADDLFEKTLEELAPAALE